MAEEELARKLTPEEFEQLLRRAVQRQADAEPGTFTVEGFVEAGHELGIDADTNRRMVAGRRTARRIAYLALDHGTDTYELLETHSHAEQAWAAERFERWLGRARS